MEVLVLNEGGYEAALYGLGLSFGKTSATDFAGFDPETMRERAERLSGMGDGHDKFLRMISVWLSVRAPLAWWKQFDTYKIGTTAQSESTMHTLMRTPIREEMFSVPPPESALMHLDHLRKEGDFVTLNALLPQGWLQRRVVSLNYAVLQNIIRQREGHKLREWRTFCDEVRRQVAHPELL